MTIWEPWLADAPGPLYRRVALALQQDISAGRLQPGTRLPTHRELARDLATTVVTASRAYREAAAWGLVQGQVGRGTFVAPAAGGGVPAAPCSPDLVELNANYVVGAAGEPDVPRASAGEARLLRESLRRHYPAGGAAEHRAAAAAWLRRGGWAPRPEEVVVTAGAQHAIFVALAALARPGDTLYVEALTFPGVKMAARSLGLQLRPVAVDAQGLVPEALAESCGAQPGGLLFCQPSLHNPTATVMPAARRRELAALARERDLILIEDSVYEFLLPDAPPPPLAALAPERTLHIVSGAKAFMPGLRVGFLTAPEPLVPRLQAEIFSTCLVAAPSLLDLVTRWIADGSAQRSAEAKRREVELRQQLARSVLGPASRVPHSHGSHLWLELPAPWRPDLFVEQARRWGVAVNPASAFAADPAAAPAAVRICLGAASDRDRLAAALAILAEILAGPVPPEEPVV
jgi:DNA-binding transcriptional MocR family regulator